MASLFPRHLPRTCMMHFLVSIWRTIPLDAGSCRVPTQLRLRLRFHSRTAARWPSRRAGRKRARRCDMGCLQLPCGSRRQPPQATWWPCCQESIVVRPEACWLQTLIEDESCVLHTVLGIHHDARCASRVLSARVAFRCECVSNVELNSETGGEEERKLRGWEVCAAHRHGNHWR